MYYSTEICVWEGGGGGALVLRLIPLPRISQCTYIENSTNHSLPPPRQLATSDNACCTNSILPVYVHVYVSCILNT